MALSKFGSAFAAARKSGAKTFEFNGKKYTTQTRDEAVKTPAASRAQSDSITARKATASEMGDRRRVDAQAARKTAMSTGTRADRQAAQAAERAYYDDRLKKKYGGK